MLVLGSLAARAAVCDPERCGQSSGITPACITATKGLSSGAPHAVPFSSLSFTLWSLPRLQKFNLAHPRPPLTPTVAAPPMAMANVYFLNAAPFPVEVLQLDAKGVENSHGLIQPGTRRMRPSYQGDAWRARAVRPGHAGDRRLLAEHVVGPVPIEDCEWLPKKMAAR